MARRVHVLKFYLIYSPQSSTSWKYSSWSPYKQA